jgi:hypothetical protein
MRDPLTAPAEAYTPDADRAGPDAPAHTPEWLVQCLVRLILFVLEHLLAGFPHRSFAQPSWHDRPDLPPGSAQAEAASIRGSFGTAIAWMCRRHGIGPDARGQIMAGPAVLIRAGRESRPRPGTAHAFGSLGPPGFSPAP